VRKALATLPWVEQAKTRFDFKKQTVTIGYKDKAAFDPQAVINALETVGRFKGASQLEIQ
jgi:hypothetical protein